MGTRRLGPVGEEMAMAVRTTGKEDNCVEVEKKKVLRLVDLGAIKTLLIYSVRLVKE
ncbi:hypothetical protein QJS10_CPB13g01240 [Acorus calamus]|uniref:Uncharacterized protein n=1 Tax=Acorus calamus TaxID=4465 RepID=A0AAV9DJD7_ACOCL|nr:hypothetical protein QJS10_CPB13g01240 [Acorus calamus]